VEVQPRHAGRPGRFVQRNLEEEKVRTYVKDVAGGGAADRLAMLTELKQRGMINETEVVRGKAKILS
jgi:hypothetical protein